MKRLRTLEFDYQAKIKELEEKLQQQTSQVDSSDQSRNLRTVNYKEFKIHGKIAERGQKDSLTFSSLIRQIERGKERGYKESEVVSAVISAVSPGLPLRGYPEDKKELKLPQLRRILRVHYQEKDATEMYVQLTKLAQGPRENPQDFLLRALDLKQKILFASQEEGASVTYGAQQVQALFTNAVTTRMNNNYLKWEVQQITQKDGVTDEEILEKISKSAKQELERQSKLKTKVYTVQASEDTGAVPEPPKPQQPQKGQSPKPKLYDEVQELRSEVMALKEALAKKDVNEKNLDMGNL